MILIFVRPTSRSEKIKKINPIRTMSILRKRHYHIFKSSDCSLDVESNNHASRETVI